MSCAATMPASRGTKSAGTCRRDFGFPIDVHAHEPETIYVVPIKSDSEHFPPDGKLRVYRSRTGRQRVGGADEGAAAARLLRECSARRDDRRLSSIPAASISERPAARSMDRPMVGTVGSRLSGISRRCSPWKRKHCNAKVEAEGIEEWYVSFCRNICEPWRASAEK